MLLCHFCSLSGHISQQYLPRKPHAAWVAVLLAVTQRACLLESCVTHLWLHAFEGEVLDKSCHQL